MSKIRHFGGLVGICAGALVCGTAAAGGATGWTVAEDASAVKFSFVQQGSRMNGRFEEFDATIDFDPKNPASGSIVGVVQVGSVDTRDYDRDATLQEADWFNAAEHPEARFESKAIEAGSGGEFVASGDLTIKGRTNPATMTFTWEEAGGGAHFVGKMTVNRFDYNVGEGWNDTSFVGQDVDVEIDLALEK